MTSRLVLEYDGTPFTGWAEQPGELTVAGVLREALRTVLRQDVP
jgi:tRNA pseudouridine38-40 synthase